MDMDSVSHTFVCVISMHRDLIFLSKQVSSFNLCCPLEAVSGVSEHPHSL